MSREYILKMWPECSKRALRFGIENPEMFVELIAVGVKVHRRMERDKAKGRAAR
ncbi:MAG TPA: hypothetical protein VN857_04945 [Chthoniobacterales bacterium]|jgi:hypothetical protein|nr:hypothetical protein [Chthoniobacterales bacterium]